MVVPKLVLSGFYTSFGSWGPIWSLNMAIISAHQQALLELKRELKPFLTILGRRMRATFVWLLQSSSLKKT
jgi:hypothetical protein